MVFTPDYAPISHDPKNIPGRKPKRHKRKDLASGMANRTSKPVFNQDISSKTDPQGSNAKKPGKHGFTVGMRF